VQVDYYYDCAETKPYFTKTYTNQIGIPGISFADSGDSGALVLDDSNAEAVGLLFASGAGDSGNGFSVANPIREVLTELAQKSQSEGQQFHIVGGAPHPITCSNYDQQSAPAATAHQVSAAQLAAARSAADTAAAVPVRSIDGVLGMGTGQSLDRPGDAAVIVYVDKNKPEMVTNLAIPKTIDGIRTVLIPTDEASVSAGAAPATPPEVEGIHLAPEVLRAAAAVQQKNAPQLMSDPAFFGVGVTQSRDNPAEAALLVLVDEKKTPKSLPDIVGGLRVRYLRLNRLHVTRSKFTAAAQPTSCEIRSARGMKAPQPILKSPGIFQLP
jgi:hypothetical protein